MRTDMSAMTAFESYMERIGSGGRLSPEEVHDLSGTPDILSLGMLADAVRRRLHDTRVTFLRVAELPFDGVAGAGVPTAAREVRLTGAPEGLDAAAASVEVVKGVSGHRSVAGFSWADVDRWSAGTSHERVLERLRQAGLDAIAELPLDLIDDAPAAVQKMAGAGFRQLRLTIAKAPADARTGLLLRASELHERFGVIQLLNPLPTVVSAFRPTTGYEDVKMVALARLAAPGVPSIQVDWRRYGPKLAQVALTFGADDLDGISPSDEAPQGRRRAPRAEIERNVQAAGLSPAERDGWFHLV